MSFREAEVTKSLSNLYKAQVNQSRGETYTRVIDHNELLEQKLSALVFERRAQLYQEQQANKAENGEDAQNPDAPQDARSGGFSEGLFGISLDVPQELEIDYVEKAKEEAEQILSKTKADAQQILEKAVKEAAALKESARKEAEEKGYAEGLKRAEAIEQQGREQLERERAQQQRSYEEQLHAMEPQLMDTVIQIFDQVLHSDLAGMRVILLHLIRRTVQHIKNSREFRIFVSASDYEEIMSRKGEIFEKIGGEAVLDIIMDESMQPGQCTIDTDEGLFDCGLDVQLANLTKGLRALACTD